MDKFTLEEIANKVEWEGGIWDALAYGIKSGDIADKKLSDLWKKLEAFADSGVIDEIEEILESVETEES